MPVTKYRSVDEMPDERWREPGSPAHIAAMKSLWSFSAQAFPRCFPAGVYRHRSRDDADAQGRRWEDADFEALWRKRGGRPDR